jgi:P-type E1-E2 ATPase
MLTASLATMVGSRRLAEAHAAIAATEREGRTAVVVLVDNELLGVLTLVDRVRGDAASAVRELAALTGRTPVLLTGDNLGAATRLAEGVGISDVHAGLLPHDKVAHVRALQQAGRRVLVVGGGVNDAPALAAADLGLAMGRHGSDLALETADAVIVRDDLATVATVIALSRRARRIVTANLIIAAAVITALVAWDLLGHLPLPLGVAGHEGSTVIVGLNGLRLLRASAWRRAGTAPEISAPTTPGTLNR